MNMKKNIGNMKKISDRIGGRYGDRVGVRISGDDGQILKTKE